MAGPAKNVPFGGSLGKFKHDAIVGESASICVFGNTGKYLASCQSALDVKLWSTERNVVTATLTGHEKPVVTCAFAPDDSLLATCSRDSDVRLWDPATGDSVGNLRGHKVGVAHCVFSPDGKTLASCADDGTVKLWDVASKKERLSFSAHKSYAFMLAFSPDGTKLASCGWDHLVMLWDVETGANIHTYEGHKGGVRTCQFSPDGKAIATCSVDCCVGLWDVEKGGEFAVLEGHKDEVASCSFSPDGRMLLSCSKDKSAKLWDVNKPHKKKKRGGTFKLLSTIEHPTAVTSCGFSPDGSRIMTTDRCIRLYRLRILQPLIQIEGHKYGINGATFSPDGHSIASWAGDHNIRLFNVSPDTFTENPDLALAGLMFDTDSLERVYKKMIEDAPVIPLNPENPFSLQPLPTRPFAQHVATLFDVFRRFLDVTGWDQSSERDFEAGIAVLDRYMERLTARAVKDADALQAIFTKLRRAQRTLYRNVMCGIRSEPHYVPFIECSNILENLLAQQPRDPSPVEIVEKFGAAQMLTLYRHGLEAKSTHQQFLSLVCTKAGAKMGDVAVKNMAQCWQDAKFAQGMKNGDGDGGHIACQSALEIITGTVEFDSTSKMLTFLELMTAADPSLAEHSLQRGWSAETAGINTKIRLISVRDGFGRDDPDPEDESTFATPDSPYSDGWCECVVSFYFLFDDTQHICSVRLIHTALAETRKNMGNAAQIEAQMVTARSLLQGSTNAFLVGEAREDQDEEEEVLAQMMEEQRAAPGLGRGISSSALQRKPSMTGMRKKQSFYVSNAAGASVKLDRAGVLEDEDEEEEEGAAQGQAPQMLGNRKRGVSSAALFRRGGAKAVEGGENSAPGGGILRRSQSSRKNLRRKTSFQAIGEGEAVLEEEEEDAEALERMRTEFDKKLQHELSTLGQQARVEIERKVREELTPVIREELRAEVEAEFKARVRRDFENKIRDELIAEIRKDMEGTKRRAIEDRLREEATRNIEAEMAEKRRVMQAKLDADAQKPRPDSLSAPMSALEAANYRSLSPEAPKIPMARLGSRSASGKFNREPSELEEGMRRSGSFTQPFVAMGAVLDTSAASLAPGDTPKSSRLGSIKKAIKKVL